jgi:hypothetical protein
MASNGKPQFLQPIFSLQSNGAAGDAVNASVRQDKARISSARIGTNQPAPETKSTRAHQVNSHSTRFKLPIVHKSRTEKLTAWVNPLVKAELARRAAQEGVSLSAATAAFLEQALQNQVDLQYSALLEPIITSAIRKELRGMSNRFAWLLARNVFASEQTRSLVTNILGRQPGITKEKLQTILAMSQQAAKGNLTRRNPELEELIASLRKWLEEEMPQDD